MKIRHSTSSGDDTIQLQMTPMIDIVFQLLVFFIMTFKIVSEEGDFNIRMPLGSTSAGAPQENLDLPIKVRLQADQGTGRVTNIRMNELSLGNNWQALQNEIIAQVGTDSGPNAVASRPEVELDCDPWLNFEETVAAISAVSGYIDRDSEQIVRLLEKIKFSQRALSDEGGQ